MEKTNVKVKAWKENGEYVGDIDIADLKPGMMLRYSYFVEVVGNVTEDEIDYMIPVLDSHGKWYGSPLCFD